MKIVIEGTAEEISRFYEKALHCEETQEALREYMDKRKVMLDRMTSEAVEQMETEKKEG